MSLTERHIEILRHSLGLDHQGRGAEYRNRFVTDPQCEDGHTCEELVAIGAMNSYGPQKIAGGMVCYCVTDAGKSAARAKEPEKLTRSQQRYRNYLRHDSGMTFGEWLKTDWKL